MMNAMYYSAAIATFFGMALATPTPTDTLSKRVDGIVQLQLFSDQFRKGSSVQFDAQYDVCYNLKDVNFNDKTRSLIIQNGTPTDRNCVFTIDGDCEGKNHLYKAPHTKYTTIDQIPAEFDKKYSSFICV